MTMGPDPMSRIFLRSLRFGMEGWYSPPPGGHNYIPHNPSDAGGRSKGGRGGGSADPPDVGAAGDKERLFVLRIEDVEREQVFAQPIGRVDNAERVEHAANRLVHPDETAGRV